MKTTIERKRLNHFCGLIHNYFGYGMQTTDTGRIQIIDPYNHRIVNDFRSLQQAIDHFAYMLPRDFLDS
jgi:hypothetical protein